MTERLNWTESKSVLNIHWKDLCWSWSPILWPSDVKNWLTGKDPDAGKDWKQEEKQTTEDEMSITDSWTRWTWVWASSGSWWRTGKPGVLHSMGSQRVGHNWVEQQQCRQRILPTISVNKGCCGHQVISHCTYPQECSLRSGFRTEKSRNMALDR